MKKRDFLKQCTVGLLTAACSTLAPIAHAQAVKLVGTTAIVEHPALNAIHKGVEDELKAQGWVPGKNLKLNCIFRIRKRYCGLPNFISEKGILKML